MFWFDVCRSTRPLSARSAWAQPPCGHAWAPWSPLSWLRSVVPPTPTPAVFYFVSRNWTLTMHACGLSIPQTSFLVFVSYTVSLFPQSHPLSFLSLTLSLSSVSLSFSSVSLFYLSSVFLSPVSPSFSSVPHCLSFLIFLSFSLF